MNLQAIRYFVMVADTLNFTRAAERLYVSQPAISRQIKQLERELGLELLQRSHHAVDLTAAGSACLPAMRTIVSDCDRLERMAGRFSTGLKGSVGIGYPNVAALAALSEAIKEMRERYPLVQLDLHQVSAISPLEELEAGRVQMVITLQESVRRRKEMAFTLLKRGRLSAIVPVKSELGDKNTLTYSDIKGHPIIMHEMNSAQQDETGLRGELNAHGIDYDRQIFESRTDSIMRRVMLGEGIGLMPDGILYFHLSPLRAIPVCDSTLENDVVLAWRATEVSREMEAFAQIVEKHAIEST